jgi:hypothetical protein
MAESDFSCPFVIGYGSSPSRCGPSLSRDADGQTRDLPASEYEQSRYFREDVDTIADPCSPPRPRRPSLATRRLSLDNGHHRILIPLACVATIRPAQFPKAGHECTDEGLRFGISLRICHQDAEPPDRAVARAAWRARAPDRRVGWWCPDRLTRALRAGGREPDSPL